MNYVRNNMIATCMIIILLGMGEYTGALIGVVAMGFINMNRME